MYIYIHTHHVNMSSIGSFPLFRNPSSGSIDDEGEEKRRGIEAKKEERERESENEAAEFQLVSLD